MLKSLKPTAKSWSCLTARFGDQPGGREALHDLRDTINSALTKLHINDEDSVQRTEKLLAYTSDLTQRERWITDEMKRRGYLPMLPGEEPYLDEV